MELFDSITLIGHKKVTDNRGSNTKVYDEASRNQFVPVECLVIESKKNVIRGLHYQAKKGQSKRITCISGKLYVVVADVSPNSKTFGKWCAVTLTQSNTSIIIPSEYAVGTYAIEDSVFLCECGENPFIAELSSGIRWDDPTLKISWPICEGQVPVISEKDLILNELKGCGGMINE